MPRTRLTPEQQIQSAVARLLKHHDKVPHPDAERRSDLPEPCWVWNRRVTNTGYPAISYGGRVVNGHRLAYRLQHGEIPPGLLVCHRCDVRACVNPAHLYLDTPAGNMADMVRKGRQFRGPRSNGFATLTPDAVRFIRTALRDQTHTQRGLARLLGVHATTIRAVYLHRTFRDVV